MLNESVHECCVYLGDELARYSFGDEHPFGPARHDVFKAAFYQQQLDRLTEITPPTIADRQTLELFHSPDYVEKVRKQSKLGTGYLDQGDTPAFIGMYEAAATVVGSVCDAIDRIMRKQSCNSCRRAFIPIAGLHHARRDTAAGFCVFNDCGVGIEYLRAQHGVKRIAYVDIDAHHGDGVFYSFEDDPELIFADLHEDGRYLYPGTGGIEETGKGEARGTKLNIPMPPEAGDELFMQVWPKVETFLRRHGAEFILLQCGADSIAGDPITHLHYSEASHAHAARRLRLLADELCDGRLLAMGGGGYHHNNIARTWTAVVQALA